LKWWPWAQTGATLSADDYDEQIIKRMSEAAGVPAVTSARAIGLAVRALGARRIALVSPFPIPVLERAKRHYTDKYGLEVVALESFSGADSIMYPTLGPDEARDAIARTDRPEIEVFVVPAGNLPTMSFVPRWERAVGKPVISTNQATLWAMLQIMRVVEKLPGLVDLADEEGLPANRRISAPLMWTACGSQWTRRWREKDSNPRSPCLHDRG
jgi:maleate isomerase